MFRFFVSGLSCGHRFYIKKDGTVMGFGRNGDNQLCLENQTISSNSGQMKRIIKVSSPTVCFKKISEKKIPIKKVLTGPIHSFLLTKSLELYGIGFNRYGQLGLGDRESRRTLERIKIKNFSKIDDITVGYRHTIFHLGTDYYSAGTNANGQLAIGVRGNGNGVCTPQKIVSICGQKFLQAEAGAHYTIFLTTTNTVMISGKIKFENPSFVPLKLTFPKTAGKIKKIFKGFEMVLFQDQRNEIFGMGNNDCQNLCIHMHRQFKFSGPYKIKTFEQFFPNVLDIKCGRYHTLFLLNNGTVYGMGDTHYYGIIPDKYPLHYVKHAAEIFGLDNVKLTKIGRNFEEIKTGYWSSWLFNDKGEVFCSGNNEESQLGLGDVKHRNEFFVFNKSIVNMGVEEKVNEGKLMAFRQSILKKCESNVFIDVLVLFF